MNKFLCSINFTSAGLCGALIFFLLIVFSGKGDTRTVIDVPYKANINENKTADYLQSYSNLMKSYMNVSVAPCEDFYEYACGNYRFAKSDRDSIARRYNTADIKYTLADITRQLVSRMDLAEALNVSSELMVAQRFYNACLGAELYPFRAADPAYLSLIRSIGGFPAVDGAAWNASNFKWRNMSEDIIAYGAKGLFHREATLFYSYTVWSPFGFDTQVNKHNIDIKTSRSYRANEERMRGYLRAFKLTDEKIAQVIDGVFAFWREALQVFEETDLPTFTDKLNEVFARHSEALANYLAMDLLFHFDAKLSASKYQTDYCAAKLMTSMSFLFDKLYMAEYLPEGNMMEVSKIVRELQKSLRKSLQEADWMDSKTRRKALLKASAIVARVGAFRDDDLADRLVREIGKLRIFEDSYATTNIHLNRLEVDLKDFSSKHSEELAHLTKPQDTLLGMQVQANYLKDDNSIIIGAGLLYPPVYHRSWPLSLKFGSLGFLVGHELTHGFEEADVDVLMCYLNHYSKYLIPEINRHINGEIAARENLGDNGGIKLAFEAYRSQMQKLLEKPGRNITSEQMPGLDLLPDQLFFLGFAQLYCADYKEEHYWDHLYDKHTIEKYRVLGALSNSEDFFQAFNCPVGSGMRPAAKTCHVW
ncbi:neprilysin-1-like [Drosophila elegans]|uniref:neprilysin-1-like n=1 Tax=Drosophila elegans TaxID=30023 RepID=UPI0007E62663|nr:neprilysin-1-like [Drosophila elegans]